MTSILQKKSSSKALKCIKCGRAEATEEGQLCEGCSFMATLENIVKKKEE